MPMKFRHASGSPRPVKSDAMRRRPPRGFSFLEMTVVLAILMILMAIIGTALSPSSQLASASSARSQLQAVRTQVERYRLQNDGFVPVPTGPHGTSRLWEELTTPQGEHPALLKEVPELPDGFLWHWNGGRLSLTYSGVDESLQQDVPDW